MKFYFLPFFLLSTLSLHAKDSWLTETSSSDWKQKILVEEKVYYKKSPFHQIKVLQTPRFGKMLVLDGTIHFSEKDEFIGNELMAHAPLLTHGQAKKVLILGGANPGLVREVLKHPSVEQVMIVEKDKHLIECCKKHLTSISQKIFEDPRVKIALGSSSDFLKETPDLFDIILCDVSRIEHILFTKDFYADCQKKLDPNGIFVLKRGIPFIGSKEMAEGMQYRSSIFKDSRLFFASVPSEMGGLTAFEWSSNDPSKEMDLSQLTENLKNVSGKMRYYTPEIHKAAFALPPYIGEYFIPSND